MASAGLRAAVALLPLLLARLEAATTTPSLRGQGAGAAASDLRGAGAVQDLLSAPGLGDRGDDSEGRMLGTIFTRLNLSGIALRLTINQSTSDVLDGDTASLYAGQSIQGLQLILATGDNFSASAPSLKFVNESVDSDAAIAGACAGTGYSLGLSQVNQPFGGETGASGELLQNSTVLNATLNAEGLAFRMGSSYRLCYSDTGTFSAGHADVLNVSIDVSGVYDSCTSADCLAQKRYYCHARKDAHSATGSCAMSFLGAGNGLYGTEGKMTWSQAWSATWDASNGVLQGLTTGLCGSAPSVTVLCSQSANSSHPTCNGTDLYIEPNTVDAKFELPMTRALTSVTEGYTVAACYCPALDSCDANADFIQQIGVVLVFTAKPCDPNDASCSSSSGFTGVVPKQPFTFMVHCPPDGCPANDNSRLKLADVHADNDRPSWDTEHGCRTAAETALQASPLNCYSATNCVLTGGTRQDYKTFGSSATSFQLAGSGSDYEVRNFHTTKSVDACFCVDGCASPSNWFKVGHVVLSPYRVLNLGNSQLATANVPGSLGLYRGASDRDSLGLMPDSLVKLLVESANSVGDPLCRTEGSLAVMGMSEAAWRLNHKGSLGVNRTDIMTFNSGDSANLLAAVRAGVIAVCYCRSATCATVSDDWILAARITVRGPVQNQAWTFSTGVAVRISYAGYGLSSSDKLRLTPSNVPCDSSSNNPESETSVMVGCPLACSTVDNILTRMELATKVLDYASVGCDAANANCQTVYINRITVQSATTTEVEFDGDPGLSTGDRVVLGSGIQCGTNCSAEQLAAIGGSRTYGNGGAYDVGALVTATAQEHIFTIAVGWAAPVPVFDVPAGQGQWTRTSTGTTAQEIKGTVDKTSLKVCWAHGGDGTYVDQVGTVTFNGPPLMIAQVSLTAMGKGTAAPVIVSFTTGQRSVYSTAANSLQLKLVFTNVNHLEPHYADKETIVETPGVLEHSLADARQTTCGKLFLELWSADSAAGFPMPQGCYYKLLGTTRELFIVFEPGNGLRSGKTYQLVMVGTAKNGLLTGNEAVSIMSLGDVVLNPYEVIELGRGSANKVPLDGATSTEPRFKQSNGLSVLGGTSALLELGSELDFSVQLAADSTGHIVKETIVRLFMMPLTQWDMSYTVGGASECSATCTPHDFTRCGPVGQCIVEPVVASSLKNTIKIRLPVDMTAITDVVQHVFRIRSLSVPSGGFFATRIGAQLTTKEDLAPFYTESSGDYLWKRPSTSSMVGELIVRDGDGNAQPFRGESGNVLHAHLRLGATLQRSEARTSSASLTITLPQGYTGVRVSAAPRTLGALLTVDAPGRGTPDVRRWSCVGGSCTYRLEVNDVIPVGTDLVASFLVNNPTSALRQDDALNKWYTTLRSTGDHTTTQVVQDIVFQGTGNTDFGSNVAVLGKLTDYCIQPTDFTISPSVGAQVTHDLLVFFRPAQSVASGGYVLVDAPALFDFGNPCVHQDLEAAYHQASGGEASARTWALPPVQSCAGVAKAGLATKNRAQIALGGLLHQQRRYGFRVRVTNPQTFTASQLTGWSLSTATSGLQIVDGTPTTASFNPLAGGGVTGGLLQSWGLYAESLNTTSQVAFHLSSMKPYALTGEEATITVFPLRPGLDVETSLRIIAPHGYEWYFSAQDFVYRADPGPNVSAPSGSTVSGATADLPGRVPTRNGNVLTWPIARYSAAHTYGFVAKVRVPPSTPRDSSNAFFVEFGYNDQALLMNSSRALAARVEAPAIQALTNANVDYTTSVRGQVNKLQFQVKTVTRIPHGGGLFIRGPVGFSFPDACQPEVTTGSGYMPLPDDLSCRFKSANSGGTSELLLVAGESGIPPGFYAFQVAGTNPPAVRASRDGESTACGWTECWHFHSLSDAANPLASPELDARASTPGFPIKDAMTHAHLVPLSQAGRTSTGRNDLPTQQNRLTFSFKLGSDVSQRSMLVLRGPAGFQFEEDCLANSGVVTEPTQISATAATLLQPHGAWEAGVPVLTCTGSSSVARLEVGAGLKKNTPYLFCIKVKANPSETPAHNKWTIESDGEASAQFDGFTLMTFTKASVSALRTAARPPGQQPLYFVNVTFRPYTDVPAPGGTLAVTAPSGFSFVYSTTGCPLLLEERDPLRGSNAPAAPFLSSEVSCVAGANADMLMVELKGARSVVAGRDYTLTAHIINPGAVTAAAQWKLESFTDVSRGTPLDATHISGFAINRALTVWRYVDAGETMRNGGMNVDDLQLRMTFPDALSLSDTIVILAPVGYDLSDPANREGERRCKNQRWGSSDPFTAATVVTCEGRRLTVLLGESQAVAAGTELRFYLSTKNPSRSPSWAENFWHIRHLNGQSSLLSSDVFAGWAVVPQLAQVQVTMNGQASPAGSVATLDFAFYAASAASSVTIEAKAPSGFDFSQSFLPLAGQEPSLTVGSIIRCTVAILAGAQTLVRVRDVRLASIGGLTQFDITTYTSAGSVADRTLGFTGFRLPGSVQMTRAELLSEYGQSPSMYPVKALWQPQLGAAALARLTLTFSNTIAQGQALELQGSPYTLKRQNFRILDVASSQAVPVVVTYAAGSSLVATLQGTLQASREYSVEVAVVAPQQAPSSNVWSLQTTDGGALPTSLNSQISTGFRLVSTFGLAVTANRIPPVAEVEITLQVSFASSAIPSALTVVAPIGFNFSQNCLVKGGAIVSSCAPGALFEGRSTAQLGVVAGSSGSLLQDLKLKVTTPRASPSVWSWFIEGVDTASGLQAGWGEDTNGLQVQQMRDVSVTYGGIPSLQTQIVVGFRTSEVVDRGGQIQVFKPPEYDAQCNATTLQSISLPGVLGCQVQSTAVLLTLNATLQRGEYAFAFNMRTPSLTPGLNQFSLVLVDKYQVVQDAAMDVAGQNIRPGYAIQTEPLSWTASEAGQASSITVGFSVRSEIPLGMLSKVLITFPQNFAHAIERECSVERTNTALPLLPQDSGQCSWIDIRNLDRLLLHLDPNVAIPAGTYSFRFPVTVPEQLPAYNVWLVTFCGPSAASCLQPHSPDALLTFPLAGFRYGQQPPGWKQAQAAAWHTMANPLLLLGTLLLPVFTMYL